MRSARIITSLYFPVFHRIEHHGKEHWPEHGPLIVVSNHPTLWDPWIVGMGTRAYVHWMAWDAIFKWPFFGWVARSQEAFPVDLDKPKPSTLRQARAVIRGGGILGVFPEGGRTSGDTGELDPLKRGVARLALSLEAPILCVSIKGARRAWPKQRAYPLPGKIVVTYHPIIRLEREARVANADRREEERALLERLDATLRSAL